jgi:penicillin-binding protein 1A
MTLRSRRVAALLVLTVLATAGCGQMLDVRTTAEVVLRPAAVTSAMVAADGTVLAELHAEQDRDLVPFDRIPQTLRDAVVAVEDARFYEHTGIDARAIIRAFVENSREGRVTQGGSTITQQLVKNALVGDDPTLERKLAEASAALQLEAQLSKDEILGRYLNTVYFGGGAYGVQTAAQRYFGVDVDGLELHQAALLAALLKAPSAYDPFANPDAALGRRNLVIRLMAEQGFLTAEAAAAASSSPLGLAPPPQERRWRHPYFVAHVLKSLQHDPAFEVLGPDPVARADMLFRGGLRIETTLDRAWQRAAEQAVAETLGDPNDPRAALVAIDPATGSIRALVGGRDYDDPDDPHARFNLATDGRRQPGSTFKVPVLAAALAQARSLDELFPGGASVEIPARPPAHPEPWLVHNYANTEFRDLTLRQATAFSVNIVYARLVDELGAEAVADMARRLGVRTSPLPALRSIALGAIEVSPLEMASVQATLAAGGVYREPTAVTRILGPDGEVVWERGSTEGDRVLDEAVAWLTTTALQDVVAYGTGERAFLQRPTAGKTGTTTEGADAWFAGYTPDLAAAVWIGFPEGRVPMVPPRTRLRVEGGNWPAELFGRFGLRALVDTPANDFPIPDVALTTVRVDTSRNCLPNPYTPPDVIAERGYLTGTEPTEICREPTGPPTTDVPNVVGLPVEAATRLLHGVGFVVEAVEVHSVALPPGYVVEQDPEPGPNQTLEGGYVVTVFVSSTDRTQVPVPDVLNLPVDQARTVLSDAGFLVEVVLECPDGTQTCTGARERPGRVWEQRPDAGGRAPLRSVITLSAYPAG